MPRRAASRKSPERHSDFPLRAPLCEARPSAGSTKHRLKESAQKWEWHVGPAKSRKSLRRISATESVMKMVADLKVGKPETAFLFPRKCSGFIGPAMFHAEIWKLIADKARISGTRFHDLRHFSASQLIANDASALKGQRDRAILAGSLGCGLR